MASHGIVYNLFDDRYLELQDVVGNVESLPTLVPYEQYSQHMIVYRMNTGPEVFMALLQDFTRRKATETRKELWAWCVQWKVDEAAACEPVTPPHSPKKPRLTAPPIKGHVRTINPQLMIQGDMLRILLDILQVGSSVVPNFIEFLYRWIDYYEGDGKALKAALHKEIPSLWAFDYHPMVFPRDVKKMNEAMNKLPNTTGAEELAQPSQTRTFREKPDLAALHRKVEESERLQYREVHFGIQPPKLREPLPPLINVPRDAVSRIKFYSACFKSRQRAFNLLIEAGMTSQQMRDYQRNQEEDPRDTPLAFGRDGLKYYRKDAALAQRLHTKQDKYGDKDMEVAISEKLAFEAQFSGLSATPEDSFGVPLIPNRPVPAPVAAARSEDIGDEMLRKIRETKDRGEQRINIVPAPLAGKLRGELFEGAIDKQALLKRHESLGRLLGPSLTNTLDGRRSYTDSTGYTNAGEYGDLNHGDSCDNDGAADTGLDIPLRFAPPRPRPPLPNLSLLPIQPLSIFPSIPTNSSHLSAPSAGSLGLQQSTSVHGSLPHPSPAPNRIPTSPHLMESMQSLTPEQARSMVSRLSQAHQETKSMLGLSPHPSSPVSPPQGHAQHPAFVVKLTPPQEAHGHASFDSFPQPPLPSGPPSANHEPSRMLGQSPLPSPRDSNIPGGLHGIPSDASGSGSWQLSVPQVPNVSANSTGALSYTSGPGLPPPVRPLGFYQSAQQHQRISQANLPQAPQLASSHQVAPGLSISAQSAGPPVPRSPGYSDFSSYIKRYLQNQQQPSPAPNSLLAPPRPGIQRGAPSPLRLSPSSSALNSLIPSISGASPFQHAKLGMPVQIYFPRVLVPGNLIGPGGAMMGNDGCTETDAFLVGYSQPGSGDITLSHAIFLPVGVWKNCMDRVRKDKYSVLETYIGPVKGRPQGTTPVPHRAAYDKLRQAYSLMLSPSPAAREENVTKRWRVSQGRMSESERGAVWEGWAVGVDKEIVMSREERKGALVYQEYIDHAVEKREDTEKERRRKEIEELLDDEESSDDDGDMNMEG